MGFEQRWGIAGVLLIVACSGGDDEKQVLGTGGVGGGVEGECIVSPSASAEPVSFRNDVLPVFGFACAGGQCHSGTRPKGDLFLGPKCDFADGVCTFPAQPSTENPTGPQPLTDADVARAWAALREPSATAPAVKRVEPGNPGASFLADKIRGIQSDKGHTCTNTESAAGAAPCGSAMPAGYDSLCDTGSGGPARTATIVNWIAQGALNN